MIYFFALGTHPELSRSEIETLLQRDNFLFKTILNTSNILVIDSQKSLPDNFINKLGGTIKMGSIIQTAPIKESQLTAPIITELQKKTADKLFLGISFYNCHASIKKIRDLGLAIKKQARESGVNLRFVESQDNPLSSVIVQKNKLLTTSGMEVIFIFTDNDYLMGVTSAVQDFRGYSKVDYGRPGRDDLSGMLPPKLAQIMINLAGVKTTAKIYDPFCGSGTIIQMAALQGFTNISGSDISAKAIRDTEKNLVWLKETHEVEARIHLFQADATDLPEHEKSFDAIITEPFLGPPLHGNESAKKINAIIKELEPLYNAALKSLEKKLNKGGALIIIIPEFRLVDHFLQMTINWPKTFTIAADWHYARPNQSVGRHIYKLIKK